MPGFLFNNTVFQVTYSGLSDFDKCPRLYYYRNHFINPETKKKIEILSPDLTLGDVVHTSIDEFTKLPVEQRNGPALKNIFDHLWPENFGLMGGFGNPALEENYKQRAKEMLNKFYKNKEYSFKVPLKIYAETTPKISLYPEKNIVLSGKTDWVEELPDKSLFVLDFKTGKRKEKEDSLQLPIYAYYVAKIRNQKVSQVGYWYLQSDEEPVVLNTDDLGLGRRIKEVIDLSLIILDTTVSNSFVCRDGTCRWCCPYEEVLKGKAKLVKSTWNKDWYLFV